MAQGISADPEERRRQMQAQVFAVEKRVEQKFDEFSNKLAQKIGMKEIPWFKWTLYMTFIYAVVTVLVLFHRSDFLNVMLPAFKHHR